MASLEAKVSELTSELQDLKQEKLDIVNKYESQIAELRKQLNQSIARGNELKELNDEAKMMFVYRGIKEL